MYYSRQLSLFDTPEAVSEPLNVPTFAQFLDEFFWPDKRGLRHTTLDSYRYSIKNYILPVFGDVPINRITYPDVQRMINGCRTYKTAKRARDTLSAVLGHACNDLHLLSINVASGRFVYPPKALRDEPFYGIVLTDFTQIVRYIEMIHRYAPNTDVERATVLGFCFGLRPSETFGLDCESIDFDSMTLRIKQAYTAGSHTIELHDCKTPESRRTLPVYGYARDLIGSLSVCGSGPWVRNYYGNRANPKHTSRRLKELRDRYKLPRITFETMRHSFATAALRGGMDVASLSLWLGHSSSSTTLKHYAKPTAEDLRNDADRIDGLCRTVDDGDAIPYDQLSHLLRKTISDLLNDKVSPCPHQMAS